MKNLWKSFCEEWRMSAPVRIDEYDHFVRFVTCRLDNMRLRLDTIEQSDIAVPWNSIYMIEDRLALLEQRSVRKPARRTKTKKRRT